MDTMYSNVDLALFSTKQSKSINRVKKYTTKLILSSITDETITDFNKLTLKRNPNTNLLNTNNNFCGVGSVPIICKNNSIKSKNNFNMDDNTTHNQTDICKNIEIHDICIRTDNNTNVHMKTTNKKQKNISFSNEKLWEINRVNQILHNKITNGVKPTYTRKKPSTSVKATSTINRERKNKDIVKGNEILAKKLRNVRSTILK